jgi:uridylate kinase
MNDRPRTPLLYRKPLVKLSGEALMGARGYGIDEAALSRIAADLACTVALGCRPALVVGGGNIYRGIAGAARGMDRVAADYLGMLATIMNALALQHALKAAGVRAEIFSGLPAPSVCRTYHWIEAREAAECGVIPIFAGGTGNPFFTTDTAATLRAAELGCDAVLKATNIDGVYTADPKSDPGAARFDRLTFTEALARGLKVMDGAAIALARDNGLPIVVFSLHEKGAIASVLRGEAVCTIISDDEAAAGSGAVGAT